MDQIGPVDEVPAEPSAGTAASRPSRERPPGVWQPGRRLLTSGLVAIVTAVAFESLAVSTVMPLVEDDLGDLWLYGWVFSGFFLGNLVATVVAGRASDRVAPAVPFAVGLAVFLVGLAVGGAAQSMHVLVLGRVLQGLGGGALPAVAYVCIGREYEPDLRPRMFALLSTAWVLPSLAGPALAGVIGEHLGWRWVFLGLLPLAGTIGLGALAAIRHIGAVGAASSGRTPIGRAVLVAVGAGLVLGGLGSRNVVLAVPLVAAGAALGVPAFLALTPPGTARARPGLPATVLTRGTLTFAFFGADAFVTLALTTMKGATSVVAGFALTSASLTWAAGAWAQERLVHTVGPRRLVRAGLVGVAVGTAAFLATLDEGVPITLSVLAWSVAGLGMGSAYAPLSVTALAEAPAGREGAATSALQLSDMSGTALGTGVAGVVVAAGAALAGTEGPGIVAVLVVSVVVAATSSALLARRVPRQLADA